MLRSLCLDRFSIALYVSLILSLGMLTGCQKPATEAEKTPESVELILGNEDILQIGTSDHGTGPVISGSLQPEIRADLRAEVSAVVLRVHKENGEMVRKGDLLVTLDNAVLRDNLSSAEESLRAAAQSLAQLNRWRNLNSVCFNQDSSIDMYNNDVGKESAQKFMKQTGDLKAATIYFAS